MTKQTLPKWTEERANTLANIVGDESPVSQETVVEAAETLETTNRSVASKLRKMGYDVESAATAHKKTFTDEQEDALREFVEAHEGEYTYEEIAIKVFGDADLKRKVQGKLLSMELTGSVKPTPQKEVQKKYSDEEEAKFIKLMEAGKYLEEIAEAMGRELNSVRGKALSLSRIHGLDMPKQKESHAANKVDAFEELGDVSEMSVAEIAEAIGKTERGVKVILTSRGRTASDYDGAARRAKLDENKD